MTALVFINPGQIFTKSLLKLMGHYISPKTESPSTIKDYVTKHDSYYDRLYVVNNANAFLELQKFGVSGVPTVQIFNKEKKLLTTASKSECDWTFADFFQNQSNKMVPIDSITYTKVMERLVPIDIRSKEDTFHYYVITYWAKYLPRLTHRLFEQTNNMKKGMHERVCFMSVSLDMQEGWDEGLKFN